MSLSVQVMIDPARRGYDPATRERLAELFGPPGDAGRRRPRGSPGRASAAVVPAFTGTTMFALELPCTYDLEVAATKYFYALRGRRGAAQLPLLRHGLLPRRDGRLQVTPVPWSSTAQFRMPVSTPGGR